MSFNPDWDTAANHAAQEIADRGTWTCVCGPCISVRERVVNCIVKGTCEECGNPLKSVKAVYCNGACRQKAYRRRQAESSAKRIYANMRKMLHGEEEADR